MGKSRQRINRHRINPDSAINCQILPFYRQGDSSMCVPLYGGTLNGNPVCQHSLVDVKDPTVSFAKSKEIFRRDRVRVRGLKGSKDIFQVFGQIMILSKSAERLLHAYLKIRNAMWESRVIGKEIKEDVPELERSLMKIRNKTSPRTLHWGTATLTGRWDERIPLRSTHWLRW